MKKLSTTVLLAFFLIYNFQVLGQNIDEVIISQPLFNQNDTGKIYQDTTNGKVYSYINNNLGTQEINFNNTVEQASDILHRRFSIGKRVFVKSTGALYSIQADPITNYLTDSCVVIPTKNGKYAILQTKDRGFYVEHFGAIPNDGLDDSQAIQKCIDATISLPYITSRVNLGPGIFDLETGIVAANPIGLEYTFLTLTISGEVPAYSPTQTTGSTTVLNLKDTTSFCLAIQKSRNSIIENIVFKGPTTYEQNPVKILEADTNYWKSKARLNRNSPSCGIAIDPFSSNTQNQNQYPNFTNYYTNSPTGGGSSMLTIRGCSFVTHYIAIANNPSSGIQNGDNIRAENCHVKRCHTFWACGQTQSRSNSIDNIYGLWLHTFIDGNSIGSRSGTVPTITNVNLAGFTKQMINVNSLFSPVRISKSYLESVWTLGCAFANNVSFDQCQIKFKVPSSQMFAPPYHLFAPYQCTFRDCSIEYFDNCKSQAPIMFRSGGLLFSGGWIEGGVIVNNGYINSGGDELHNIRYENVRLKCENSMVGKNYFSVPLANTKGVLMGKEEKSLNKTSIKFINNSNMNYNAYYLEYQFININPVNKQAIIKVANPGRYQIGDNIFTTERVRPSESGLNGDSNGSPNKPPLGFVSEIRTDTIIISSVPYGFIEDDAYLYGVGFPVFIQPIWGDFTSGSNVITNVITNQFPSIGMKIFNSAIPSGSYVTAINTTNKTITLSSEASQTKPFHLIKNAPYKQEATIDSPFQDNTTGLLMFHPSNKTPFIQGATILLNSPEALSSYYGWKCVKGGIEGTSNPPIFKALTW